MFNVGDYLRRIGVGGPVEPTWETLRLLHKRHLMSVAYDNSGAADRLPASGRLASVDLNTVFKHVVVDGNGGVCYELNRLFHKLLDALGYEVFIVAASIRQANGSYSPGEDHWFNLVRFAGQLCLVDVSFAGPSFLEPLRLSDEQQHQYGCSYRMTVQDGYRVVERKPREGEWQPVYRFKPEHIDASGWESVQLDGLDDYAENSVLAGTTLRSRASENGQMVLTGKRYLTVEDGFERIRVLVKPTEYQQVVDFILAGA